MSAPQEVATAPAVSLQETLETLTQKRTFHIRAIRRNGAGALGGNFNSVSDALAAIERVDASDRMQGIYVLANALAEGLPAENRLIGGHGVRGDNVTRVRVLPLDFDSPRDDGFSHSMATEAERAVAEHNFTAVTALLAMHGLEPALTTDTGNGRQALYRVDLEPAEATRLFARLFAALNRKFGEDAVDTQLIDAPRIVRLPGTWNRKGENTPERPWRRAEVLELHPEAGVVTAEQIQGLIEECGGTADPRGNGNGSRGGKRTENNNDTDAPEPKPRRRDCPLAEGSADVIVGLLKPFWGNGDRDALATFEVGYLYKGGVPADEVRSLSERLMWEGKDPELPHDPAEAQKRRVEAIERTIRMVDNGEPVRGAAGIRELCGEEVLRALDEELRKRDRPVPVQNDDGQPEKPSGVPGKRSHASKLVSMAVDDLNLELFRSPEGKAYAAFPDGETLVIDSKAFRRRIAHIYYSRTKIGVTSSSLHDACLALSGAAVHSGTVHPVFTRIAAFEDRVIIDLGRDDRRVLIIDGERWCVDAAPPGVYMVREPGMYPLSDPVRGKRSLTDLIKGVLNVASEEDAMLVAAWLVAAARGIKPFPVFAARGEHGAAKSTTCKTIRSFIDPNEAALTTVPKEPRDMIIAASNSYVLGYDNLSFIPDWLSDALSSIATGAGYRTRALTTDRDEMIFSGARPIILNGIPDVVHRPDLADRCLSIELAEIDEDHRMTETEIEKRLGTARVEVLAALADAVSQAIRVPVRPKKLPRMADFLCLIESAAPALGWAPGQFLKVYANSREEMASSLLEHDPVATALENLRNPVGIKCSMDELLTRVREETPDWQNRADFPRSSRGLGEKLKRLSPALRSAGILYSPSKPGPRHDRGRKCSITYRQEAPPHGGTSLPTSRGGGARGAEGGAA